MPRRANAWVATAELMNVLRERYLDKPARSVHTLADVTGVSAKTIESWARGDVSRVRFTTADRVLTRIGAMDAWHTHPGLRKFYGSEKAA